LNCGFRISDFGFGIADKKMNADDFKKRSKEFALRVIALVDALPQTRSADVLGRQLLRSATSVAANYRAACRGRSTAEFIAKLGIVEEEADESQFWIEMIADVGLLKRECVEPLIQEASELTAMTVSSIKTARRNKNSK
jgi:four helix bundle protein